MVESSTYTIKAFTDISEAQIITDVINECFVGEKSWSNERDFYKENRAELKIIEMVISSPISEYFLLETEGKIIGCIKFSLYYKVFFIEYYENHNLPTFFLDSLSILPDYQSRGLGKFLMNFSVAYSNIIKKFCVGDCKLTDELIEMQKDFIMKYNYQLDLPNEKLVINNANNINRTERLLLGVNIKRPELIKFYNNLNFKQTEIKTNIYEFVNSPLQDTDFVIFDKDITVID